MTIADTSGQDSYVDPSHARNRRRWIIAIAVFLFPILVWGLTDLMPAFRGGAVLDRQHLRIAEVRRGDLVRDVTAQGRIVVANSPTLYSPEPGAADLYVKAGDNVDKGQLLAIVVSPELGEQLAREKSELTRLQMDAERQKIESQQALLQLQQAQALAEVGLKAMQREERRADLSHAKHILSRQDYEKVKDDLDRARVEFQHANENLSLLKSSLSFYDRALASQSESQQLIIKALERRSEELRILSPVTGMVGNIHVENKQAVTANQALIGVVDLTAYEVEASIPESMTTELSPGMPAEIQIGGKFFEGILTAISPEVIGGSVRGRIRFADESPPQLRQNQRLTTRIHLEKKQDVMLVERGPYFDNFQGYIYRIEDGQAHQVNISLGSKNLQYVEVLDGVTEGDQVIVSSIQIQNSAATFIVSD